MCNMMQHVCTFLANFKDCPQNMHRTKHHIEIYIEHVLSSGLHIEHHRATPDTAFHKITEKKKHEKFMEHANTKHDLHCTSSVAVVFDFELRIGMLMKKNNARTMQAKEDHEEDSQN